jgi:hypothetical protein
MTAVRDFEILTTKDEAEARDRANRIRRDWTPVRDALERGHTLFFSDESLTPLNLKYLTNFYCRDASSKLRLRSRKTQRNGQAGRMVWLAKTDAK